MKEFEIVLGNSKRHFILTLGISIVSLITFFFIGNILELIESALVQIIFGCTIMIFWLIGFIYFANLNIINKGYLTECRITNNYIYIKNDLFDYKIYKEDIKLVYKTTINSWLNFNCAEGFKLVVECKDKRKYSFSTPLINYGFKLNTKKIITWEDTDLKKLYDSIKYLQKTDN